MNHAYYYQVQAQMKFTGASKCDFDVWSPFDLVVLRISPAEDFTVQAFAKATGLFKFEILPEFVGKWYTKAPVYSSVLEADGNNLAVSSTNLSTTD